MIQINSILFYDGHCLLCNRFMQLVFKADTHKRLQFCQLDSILKLELEAKNLIPKLATTEEESVLFLHGGRLSDCSDAILNILRVLGFPYSLAAVFFVFPRFIRDWLYRFVARNRYRFFGRSDGCLLPDKSVRERFVRELSPYAFQTPFLTARWSYLLVLNYEVEPSLLNDFLPQGLELDPFEGKHFVSLVGFMFTDTKLKGWSIPGYQHFPEINLRFYVQQKTPEGIKRGVCFIKEIVPKHAIAWVAKILYNENYAAYPMKGHIEKDANSLPTFIAYSAKIAGKWEKFAAKVKPDSLHKILPESLETFILEHYAGFTKQKNDSTTQYAVAHPPWRTWKVIEVEVDFDFANVYGEKWKGLNTKKPTSAILAEGSEIKVFTGLTLETPKAVL